MGEPKDLVRRFYDAIQAERVDMAMALCDPDIAVRNPVVEFRGREPFGAYWRGDAEAFSDRRYEVVRLIEEGGTVAVEVVFTGTHTGPLRAPNVTLPATGKPVRFEVVGFFEVEAGRIVSSRGLFDRLGFLEQLGLAPRVAAATSQAES